MKVIYQPNAAMRCTMDPEGLNGGKYTLRTKSILKRIESERSRQGGRKKNYKEKQKPPPLSKYRRKTANARERNRMREINEAFISLQESLPDLPGTEAEKLTKITVLRLAVNYIKALAKVLDGDILEPTDIDDVKELWSHDNLHIAKSENCVRSVIKTNRATPNLVKNSKSQLQSKIGCNKQIKIKQTTVLKTDIFTDKDKPPIKAPKRKSKSSKARGKICRTASVATSNGAYITLKNVAMQTTRTPNSGRVINTEPLIMSMTVKRPRLEPFSSSKSSKYPKLESYSNRGIKMSRFDHILPLVALAQPHISAANYGTKLTNFTTTIPSSNMRTLQNTPTSTATHNRILTQTYQQEYQYNSNSTNNTSTSNIQYSSFKPSFNNSNNNIIKTNDTSLKYSPEKQSSLSLSNNNQLPQIQTQYFKSEDLNINDFNTTYLNFTQDVKPVYLNLPFDTLQSPNIIQAVDKPMSMQIPTSISKSPLSIQPVSSSQTEQYSTGTIFHDLDNSVIRNDVLLEYPQNDRHLSTSSSDSAFYSEASDPDSPVSTTFANTPLGEISPCGSYSSLSAGSHHSECDSVLSSSMEFSNILGCEPFEAEFNHLTPTFGETDDTLNIFLDNASSHLIGGDIDGC